MKEFFLPLEHVAAGLRHDPETRPGQPGLVLAENLRPSPGGLRPGYQATEPLGGAAWPYPQLFATRGMGVLLATETAWYSYDGGAPVPLVSGLAAGHPWALADFHAYLLATNGSCRVARDPGTGNWAVDSNPDIPDCGALGVFNGQAVAGDLTPAWHGAGPNWVAWSRIGEGSFTPDLKNTAGFMPMAWQGRVLAVKQLGQHVMVYGDNGVSCLVPVSSPAATFGLREMPFAGVAGRLAVAGDHAVHYFVDSEGELWRLTDNSDVGRLGYREFIKPLMAAGEVVLAYNRQAGEVIISGQDRHYVYSSRAKSLAGPVHCPVSGAAHLHGELMLVGPATQAPEKAMVVTDVLDMGKRSIKHLEWVEVVGANLHELEVAVDYRHSGQAGEWTRSAWMPAGPEGIARVGVTGTEFRLCARCDLAEGLLVSGFNVRWKAVDKRFTRGPEGINWGQGHSVA